jgi:hypothetical protein
MVNLKILNGLCFMVYGLWFIVYGEWQPLLPKGVPRKVSTSGLRGDIVRFAQQ